MEESAPCVYPSSWNSILTEIVQTPAPDVSQKWNNFLQKTDSSFTILVHSSIKQALSMYILILCMQIFLKNVCEFIFMKIIRNTKIFLVLFSWPRESGNQKVRDWYKDFSFKLLLKCLISVTKYLAFYFKIILFVRCIPYFPREEARRRETMFPRKGYPWPCLYRRHSF